MQQNRGAIVPKEQIIGGVFGLEGPRMPGCSLPDFLRGNIIRLATARSGIAFLTDIISPSHIWMPSYLCGVMVEAGSRNRTPVRFYEVDYDLKIPAFDWLDMVKPRDIVVLIDYFGFPCDRECARLAIEKGAFVLEDACQALLSKRESRISDFVLYSPRKFLGIPDGGILAASNDLDSRSLALTDPPAEWWMKAFSASMLRREFDLCGGGRQWFRLFQEAEAEGPVRPYAMSRLSDTLLRHYFDYAGIARRRVTNYRHLLEMLATVALFPYLPEGVVPLGFPIRIKDRDRVRHALFDHAIYPPVHWDIEALVPAEFKGSHLLASEIMTLPCDQRYDDDDMERMAAVILKEIKKEGARS